MKVLVTGANGFLASNIIRELTIRNIEVRGMVRNHCNEKSLEGLDTELYRGNIVNYADVSQAVNGCNVIIHTAADTSQFSTSPLPLYPVNVNGTANVIKAAKEYNVKRLIFVSTANTIGLDPHLPDKVHDRMSRCYLKSGYAMSKHKAEELVLQEVRAGMLNAVIVNPTFMIGPYDAKPSSGRIFMLLLNRRVVFYPPGGKNFVDVRSVATAICNAISFGKSGERYVLAGLNLSFKQFVGLLDKYEKRKPIVIKLPSLLLITAGLVGSVLRVAGLKNELNYYNARILTMKEDITGIDAQRELKMPETDIHRAIEDAVSWFRINGYLQGKKR